MNKKKYYNLISFIIRNKENVLIGLLIALNNSNFIIKVRYLYVKNMHEIIIKRILEQIVFIDDFQKSRIKRFYSDFLIENDVIFNTNAHKLLLFVIVNIINTVKFFSVFFFVTFEFEVAINYFLDILKKEIFNDCRLLKVNLFDQRKGYIVSFHIRLSNY